MNEWFNFNIYPYSTDNLTKAMYTYQLQKQKGMTLNLDYATTGVGCTPRCIRCLQGDAAGISENHQHKTYDEIKILYRTGKIMKNKNYFILLVLFLSALQIKAQYSFDNVLYGAAYYHEYMPYERLDEDIRLMKRPPDSSARWRICLGSI